MNHKKKEKEKKKRETDAKYIFFTFMINFI